jgi:putative transposase
MPRLPRYVLPGHPQHITQRGVDRAPIFAAVQDYVAFRDYLRDACERHACQLHAYVLMTNHVHLLLSPSTRQGMEKVMQSVGVRYVRHFNETYRRTGPLWEGRYRATPIDSGRYLLSCYRYIELNPVRAGLVTHPALYEWSSHRANALGFPDPLVTAHSIFASLGPSVGQRCAAYRRICRASMEVSTLAAIRDATNKGWALGSEQFREQIEVLAGRRSQPLRRTRPAA